MGNLELDRQGLLSCIEQQNKEIEALKTTLRETVLERDRFKQMYTIRKKIGQAQDRHIRFLENTNLIWQRYVSG